MTMTEARFMALLAAYGAELSRWPADERAAAEALLAVAPHRLKDIWESERVFDRLLTLEKDVPASISLESRLLAASPEPRAARRPHRLFGRWTTPQWATGGAIAASLALGFAAGYAGEPKAQPENEYAQMLALNSAGAGNMFLTAVNDSGN
jgi:anti-sigma-K factor RskA